MAARTFSILKPANSDDLIREEDFVKDERLPYWADVWPSSLILAEKFLELEGRGQNGARAGMRSGAEHAGRDESGLRRAVDRLLRGRARRHARECVSESREGSRGRDLSTGGICPVDLGNFDLVFASDVLYEKEYALLLPVILARVLARNGRALIADPGRVARRILSRHAGSMGW